MAEENKKQKRTFENITTPAGIAQWPWLNKPNTRFNPEGEYSCNLILEAEDAKSLCEKLDAIVEKTYQEAVAEAKPQDKKRFTKADPYSPEFDDDGNETGRIIIKTKNNAQFKAKDGSVFVFQPKIFDAKGGKVPAGTAVYGGSIIKIACQAKPYVISATKACGVSLKLQAVQVIKLVAGGMGGDSMDSYGFGEEDGYEAEASETFEEVAATTEEDF